MNPAEPKPRPTKTAKPPRWLLARPRRAWRELSPMLRASGVQTEADEIALGMLCEAFAEWRELVLVVLELGRTYTTTTASGDEMIRPRPEVAMMSDAFARLERLLTSFGMTPASRSRITAVPPLTVDPFEEFLSRPARGSLDAILS